MGSTVAAKANHYQVLGLTPAASESQIARAFADAMSMFRVRPAAALADIGVAYETLRNPAKRREYDRSIGIAPPPPPAAPRQWAIAAPPVRWAPLTGSPATALAEAAQAPATAAGRGEPHEFDPVSAIGASLREIAGPDALGPRAERSLPRADVAEARPAIPPFLAEPRLEPGGDPDSEERSFDWKRPALAVGGFVAAAGLIGTLAGLSVRDNAQPIGGEKSITAALPAAKARAATAAPAGAVEAIDADAQAPAPPPLRRTVKRREAPAWVEHSVALVDESATAAAQPPAEQAAAAADPLAPAADTAPAQPVAASLQLPNGVVARTIEHIGYSCGSVASTEAVEGAPGVFKVTCTSGQSYQASPVHGRYRFRKLGGH